MTTNTKTLSIWARSLNWLKRTEEALDYDSTQYTFDRITALQQNIDKLASRLEHLETNLVATSEASKKLTVNY